MTGARSPRQDALESTTHKSPLRSGTTEPHTTIWPASQARSAAAKPWGPTAAHSSHLGHNLHAARGHSNRVPFQTLLDYLEGRNILDEFLAQYPDVSREQAIAALVETQALVLAHFGK